jgi:FkbM family methyltransferase
MKIFQTKYGIITTFNNDNDINNILSKNKIPNEEIFEILKPYISKAHLVIDIGSSIGIRTIMFTKINPSIEIYCFEPRENFFWLLTKNLAENKISNTVLMNNMIGHIAGVIKIPSLLDKIICDHNDIIQLGDGSIIGYENDPIHFVTLDSLKLLTCDFIFIDLKGFDYLVILGGLATIKKYKPIICFKRADEERNKMFAKFGIPANNKTTSLDLLEKMEYNCTVIANDFILALPIKNIDVVNTQIVESTPCELVKSEKIARLVNL